MGFDTIPAKYIERYTDTSRYCMIDVRDSREYYDGHIPNAINIPYEDFDRQMTGLSRKKVYILYCDRGATSLLVARKMYRAGYDVLSVIGGLMAYKGPLEGIRQEF